MNIQHNLFQTLAAQGYESGASFWLIGWDQPNQNQNQMKMQMECKHQKPPEGELNHQGLVRVGENFQKIQINFLFS